MAADAMKKNRSKEEHLEERECNPTQVINRNYAGDGWPKGFE